jgi:carboxyl-terminal processing protease
MSNKSNGTHEWLWALMRGVSIGLLLILTFLAGFWLRGARPTVAAGISPINDPAYLDGQTREYLLLTQTQTLLDEHFLRTLPPQTELEYGAVRGLLGTLNDKYTFFIEPAVAASESNVLAGRYGGIGVQVTRDSTARFVLYPFRDGPAAQAGVRDGDILLRVNDQPVPSDTRPDVVDQLLRGEVKDGNGVKIGILRPIDNQEWEFQIAFAEIEIPSVNWRVLAEAPDYGYVQILRFTNRTPGELDTALADLMQAKVRGAVLDLRSNPGGLLQESIQVAGRFMNGVVVYERTRRGEKPFEAPADVTKFDLPLVVVVNGGTASAAELVAGALADSGRAVLLGQKTYGKGSIQLIFPLADKSSVHITTAEWLTPAKTQIEGTGLTPSLPMIPDAGGRDVELPEAIRALDAQVKGQ